MADIELPQLGETVTEGTITQWFKAVGDTVEVDEPLFEVSTDKVDSEVPSTAAGVLTEIRVPEGETVDVGTVLAVVSDSADAASAAPAADAPAPEASAPEPEPEPEAAPAETAPASSAPATPPAADTPSAPAQPATVASSQAAPAPAGAPAPLLSPVVRQLVNDHGLDASRIRGTGPGGRITRNDVLAAAEAAPASAPAAGSAPAPSSAPQTKSAAPRPLAPLPTAGDRDRAEPFNNMRRRTAEHMVRSKATSPHVLMVNEVDYESVERVRRAHGDAFRAEEGFGLNYLPFIALAVVDALREFPKVNASVGDGELIIHHDINLGIAVDLDHEGLIVPVVHGADDKRLRAMAREIHGVADRARSGGLSADDISGGTFTISNPGPFGTLITGAIINQPQVAILSTEGVTRRPVVVEAADGSEAIAIHSVGLLAFSFDHRAFDGAYAAAFLYRTREIIETRDWEAELA